MTEKMNEYESCSYCGGSGKIEVCNTLDMICHSEICPRCNGTGKVPGMHITTIYIK